MASVLSSCHQVVATLTGRIGRIGRRASGGLTKSLRDDAGLEALQLRDSMRRFVARRAGEATSCPPVLKSRSAEPRRTKRATRGDAVLVR